MAIAPPFGLMRGSSSLSPSSRMQAMLCAAKASLSSMMSIWSKVKPALASAFLVASTGPMPMMRGSTPTTAELTIFAKGFKLYFLTASAEATNTAAAPSFKPDEFPAVTLPSFRNAPRNLIRPSIDVLGLTNSSLPKTTGSPLRCGISTGAISLASLPFSWAFAAFCWLWSANLSWSSREMPYRSTRFSAVSPIASTPYMAAILGLMKRHPKLESYILESVP